MSGSSAATCATIGKMTLPELAARGYPEDITIGTLAGAGTLGLLIPPSIIMIVYGVTANVSIAELFIAGVIPGILLAALFSGYIVAWALLNPGKIPVAARPARRFAQKLHASRHLIPVVLLIALVLGSIYVGVATATEAAAFGVVGSLVLSAVQGSLTRKTFGDSLMGATRLYCMIALILSGAAFLTLAMGYIGLPRHLAEWIGSLGLSAIRADRRADAVLHRARLLSRRHFDGRADDGRDPADGRRPRTSTCSGSASSSCWWSRWRRSRRRSASTCSCCRA